MLRRLGYVAIALSIEATTNRTCRLRNATPALLRKLIALNLEGLHAVLQFNVQNGILLYRISSQIIPFASHPVHRVPWWDEFRADFERLRAFIRRHDMRVSMHPGQFTVLNSPRAAVVEASLKEIEWHIRFLDCLAPDASHKVVLHVGGVYGNKVAAADRFVQAVRRLPESWRRRLVIENDERVYATEDVLAISRETGLPVAFDWLHHTASSGGRFPTPRTLGACFDTWKVGDGLPKVHFSSQAPGGRKGQHANWIRTAEFERFLETAPERDFDCMLEAKCKDLALFRLRRELQRRGVAGPWAA
jgi:UV DNA damage endonuclease